MDSLRTKKAQQGFTLIESLIAIVVGGILIGTAALVIAVMLRVSKEDRHVQAAWFQNQSAMEAAASIIETQWEIGYVNAPDTYGNFFSANINTLQQCLSGNSSSCPILQYVSCDPNFSGSPPYNLSTIWNITVDNEKYYTCFDLKFSLRDQDGDFAVYNGEPVFVDGEDFCAAFPEVCSALNAHVDTSTIRLSVKTLWGASGQFETPVMHRYLTRHRNRVFHQTDWSGGETEVYPTNPDPVLAEPQHFFYSADPGINYQTPGQVTGN